MKDNHKDLTYYIMKFGKRYFIVDSEGKQKNDTCGSPDDLVDKCKRWGVPLDKISLVLPSEDIVTRILENYPDQKIDFVKVDEVLKGYIDFLKSS